jgi:hypothetical protein
MARLRIRAGEASLPPMSCRTSKAFDARLSMEDHGEEITANNSRTRASSLPQIDPGTPLETVCRCCSFLTRLWLQLGWANEWHRLNFDVGIARYVVRRKVLRYLSFG